MVVPGDNFLDYSLPNGAFKLHIGGDTITDTDTGNIFVNNFHVTNFGEFAVTGNAMAGTGPLNGHSVFLFFFGSSAPSFNSMTLPAIFPTDFTSTDLRFFIANTSSLGASNNLRAVWRSPRAI